MDAIIVYALLSKKLKGIVSGIKNITTKTDGTGIIFELNNGSKITLNIPNHVHSNLNDVLEKLTVNTNGDLFFDGIKVIRDKDVEFHVVNSYSNLPTPSINTVCYVLNDENNHEKGFYVYNSSKWTYIENGSNFELNSWNSNNKYKIGEYAYINNSLYKSLKAHTSSSNFDNDLSNNCWEMIIGGNSSGQLTEDITANIDVGNTKSGFKFTKGMTLDEYVNAVHVTYLKPLITLTPASAVYEIGTTITSVNIQAVITKRSNKISSAQLLLNDSLVGSYGTEVSSGGTIKNTVVVNTNDTNFTISCVVNDGKSDTTAKNTFKFVRYGFYGHDKNTTKCTTSNDVRKLNSHLVEPKSGNTFRVQAVKGEQRITIAIPSNLTISSAKYVEGMNAESKDIFELTNINVEGNNNYTGIKYNIYSYVALVPFSSTYTLDITLK